MPAIRIKSDLSGVSTALAASTDGSTKFITGASQEDLLAQAVLYLMDEINIIRTLGLLGLAARTSTDIKNGIAAKG